MTTWYSDVFTDAASPSAPKAGYMAPAGRQGYPKKISRIDLTAAAAVANADIVALQPVDPRERLLSLLLTVDANFAAGALTMDLGLYKLKADRTVGAVIDLNLFATLVNIDSAAVARVDEFTESASLVNLDRGKRIWELAEITVNLDPLKGRGENWVICGTLNVTTATANGVVQLETELLPV